MTHRKRSKGAVGQKVMFTSNMPLKSKKENFLANADNKQNFINFLSERLQANGVNCIKAPGDADVMIAKRTLNMLRKE